MIVTPQQIIENPEQKSPGFLFGKKLASVRVNLTLEF
jgi:hypothetical protein